MILVCAVCVTTGVANLYAYIMREMTVNRLLNTLCSPFSDDNEKRIDCGTGTLHGTMTSGDLTLKLSLQSSKVKLSLLVITHFFLC